MHSIQQKIEKRPPSRALLLLCRCLAVHTLHWVSVWCRSTSRRAVARCSWCARPRARTVAASRHSQRSEGRKDDVRQFHLNLLRLKVMRSVENLLLEPCRVCVFVRYACQGQLAKAFPNSAEKFPLTCRKDQFVSLKVENAGIRCLKLSASKHFCLSYSRLSTLSPTRMTPPATTCARIPRRPAALSFVRPWIASKRSQPLRSMPMRITALSPI